MPGKLCTGKKQNNAGAGRLRNSKSFCEGMAYRASGTAIAKPVTDNPHQAGNEASDAWILGWTIADDGAGGNVSKASLGCCASIPTVPV